MGPALEPCPVCHEQLEVPGEAPSCAEMEQHLRQQMQSIEATSPRPRSVVGWLDDRLGLSALRYPVPTYANTLWYTLGGTTLVGLVFLAITGIWLAHFYDPTPAGARASVRYIQSVAPLGSLVRGVHVWLAYLVVITATLHLIRIFVTGSYKIPRELNWLAGLGLLGLVLFGSVFTGTILRWDQESYEAMVHQMALATLLGALGGFLSPVYASTVPMVSQLYVTHVSVVPLLLVLLVIVHVFLIKHHGISPTPALVDAGDAPFGRLPTALETGHYPTHLRLMVEFGLGLVLVAGLLGILFPRPIGSAPNPAIEVTKPPFVFWWLYPFEDLFGVLGILYGAVGAFGLLVLLPFVDRTPLRHLRFRRVALLIGGFLLIGILALSLYTGLTPPAQHVG